MNFEHKSPTPDVVDIKKGEQNVFLDYFVIIYVFITKEGITHSKISFAKPNNNDIGKNHGSVLIFFLCSTKLKSVKHQLEMLNLHYMNDFPSFQKILFSFLLKNFLENQFSFCLEWAVRYSPVSNIKNTYIIYSFVFFNFVMSFDI